MTDKEPSVPSVNVSGELRSREAVDEDSLPGSELSGSPVRLETQPKLTEGKTGFINAVSEGDCVRVSWHISNPMGRDWLGLFVHERLHDSRFLAHHETGGAQEGEVVFRGLVRGYYDIRFFENGSSKRSEGVDMCVFCIGRPVQLTVNRVNRRTLAVSWPTECTDSGNWIALFPASQHGNRFKNAISQKYMREAETAAPVPRLLLSAPRTPGEYQIRFFYKDSMNVDNTNVFSGMAVVKIEQEDYMEASYDLDTMKFIVKWHAFSTSPNNWQWIGLFDSSSDSAQRLTYEYVSKHKYTSPEHDEGEIEFTQVPDILKKGSISRKMPPETKDWELRFFNAYVGAPVFRSPCFPSLA